MAEVSELNGRWPLYRRVLAERFELLHPTLRAFHDAAGGGRGSGEFRVTRPRGWLRNGLASLMGLPAAGERVPVRLEVVPDGEGERWVRHFGPRAFVTRQWLAHGLLVEAAGPMRFGFELSVPDGGLTFLTRRVWFLGVRLPLALAPAVDAVAVPEGAGWRVRVGVRVPAFGLLVQYEGHLNPQ